MSVIKPNRRRRLRPRNGRIDDEIPGQTFGKKRELALRMASHRHAENTERKGKEKRHRQSRRKGRWKKGRR